MGKNALIEDFCGIFDGYISDKQCDDLIGYYNWSKENNRIWTRASSEGIGNTLKADTACGYSYNTDSIELSWPNIGNYISEFNDVFWNECYPQYMQKYGVLRDCSSHSILTYKLQKTVPCEGYHTWHFEADSRDRSDRLGTYILYLDDVEEGGETEFLYLSKRIKPKKGRLVIFPAGYTHTHRGNPPLSGHKHIMTGWLEYTA